MGSNQSKPGVDWNAIRSEFEGGASMREIGRKHGITHRAVQKRRDREGWDTRSALYAAATKLPSVLQQATGLATTTARTEHNAKAVLDNLAKGLPPRTAARTAGIAENTLIAWRAQDDAFDALCEAAIEFWHASKLNEIDKAGERGDWKASQFRLAHNPATRELYAERSVGGGINVTLNIGRGEDKPSIIVDGKPE